MMKRHSLAVTLVVLALFQYVAAEGFGLMDKLRKPEAAVSGARPVEGAGHLEGVHEKFNKPSPAPVSGARPEAAPVSGARSIAPESVTKSEKVKAALGLYGPVVATVVPPGCKSAYSYIRGNANFTFLDNAIQATGLTSVIDDPALVATIFAPNDAAFTASLAALRVTPQELFNDILTLTVVLKYHVIPGLSLEKRDFKDSQLYDTLLTDKKKNKYPVQFNYQKEIDIKEFKAGEETAVKPVYTVVPSGGKAAQITTFDINAGCPTVVHIISRVLIPDYADAAKIEAIEAGLNIVDVYNQANATIKLP